MRSYVLVASENSALAADFGVTLLALELTEKYSPGVFMISSSATCTRKLKKVIMF
jgi:hypothetical protein